jgi:prevent-host-death family protein
MRRVPVSELNQNTAGVLARVERGERVEITRRGAPVAIIEPVQPDPLSGLIELGELRLARGPLPLLPASEERAADSAGLDALLEDRYRHGRW